MSRRRVDRVSLVAGVALVALAAVLGLVELGVVSLSPGILAACACATAGAFLVSSGLERDDR